MESGRKRVDGRSGAPSEKRSRGRPRQNREKESSVGGRPAESGIERLTQLILLALQTNDPMDLSEIVLATRTQLTSDVVYGVLEVLIVLGVVMRVSLVEENEDEGSASKRGKRSFYTLKGFCKCSEGIDLRRLNGSQVIEEKEASIRSLESRISALQELSASTLEPAERARSLRSFIQRTLLGNRSLALNPLYAALNNASLSTKTL